MVLRSLDDQSLNNSKLANKNIAVYLKNEKFYWIRMIQNYNSHVKGQKISWDEAIYKMPLNLIKQLAI